MNSTKILKIVRKYIEIFGPSEDLLKLEKFALHNENLFDRTQMSGHITCGAVVLNKQRRILMINHRKLEKWLLPGGHVESDDRSLIDAARREVFEETSIDKVHLKTPAWNSNEIPLDIDYHFIPENPSKREGAHHHWDFRYVFEVDDVSLKGQEEEVSGVEWRPIADAPGIISDKVIWAIGRT